MEGLTLFVNSDTRKQIYLDPNLVQLSFNSQPWNYGKTCSKEDFYNILSKIESIIQSNKLSFVLNHVSEDLTNNEFYYVGRYTLYLTFESGSFILSLYNYIIDVRRFVGLPSGNFPNYYSEPMDNSEKVLLLNRINKYIKEYLKDD